MIHSLAGFLVVSAIVIVTPGQDTVLTIRNTVLGGRRAGVLTGLGVAGGQALWTVAASAGLAALLAAWQPAFTAVRLAGAAYLVWLGAQSLRAAFRRDAPDAAAAGLPPARALDPAVACRQGVISNLGNPKMLVFFTSLLPQFVPAGAASFTALLSLGLLFCSLTMAWLAIVAVAVARAGDFLRGSRARAAVEAVSGVALVGLGIRLAVERE